jgi:hypothetical protein
MAEPLRVSRAQAIELALVRRVFTTVDGQTLLAQWQQTFCRRRSFIEGDPYSTAFREGQRDFVEQILDAFTMSQSEMVIEEPEEAVA